MSNTISNILNRITEFASRKGKFSILKPEFFQLLRDMVTRQQATELNTMNLTIRKIYDSVATMTADAVDPVGDDDEPILAGQLVAINNDSDATEDGKVYRYTGSAWDYVSKIGDNSSKADVEYVDVKVLSNTAFPLSPHNEILNTEKFERVKNFGVKVFLKGNRNPDKEYSIQSFRRNASGWEITIYEETPPEVFGAPTEYLNICKFYSGTNPEGTGRSIHKLTEANGSNVTGYALVDWDVLTEGVSYSGYWAVYGYRLDNGVWDLTNSPEIQNYIEEIESLTTNCYPLSADNNVLNKDSFGTLKEFLHDMQIFPKPTDGKKYAPVQYYRNYSGSWLITIYEETMIEGQEPVDRQAIARFQTSDNPETGGITIHPLTELNNSGFYGYVAVNWSALIEGTQYQSKWAGYGYALSNLIWDVKYGTYINMSFLAQNTDYDLANLKHLFAVDNDCSDGIYAREYMLNLFPESLLRSKAPVMINNSKFASIQHVAKNTTTKQVYSKSVILSGLGYKTKTLDFDLLKTKTSNAKNKFIPVLSIGNSIGDSDKKYPDGSQYGGYGFPSILKQLFMMDNIDHNENNIEAFLLGRLGNKDNRIFNYKGADYTLRSFHESRGGWAGATFLRHPIWIRGYSNAGYDPVSGATAWSFLGLGTETGEAYDASQTHIDLIMNSCAGFYGWDHDSYLWEYLRQRQDFSGIDADYTGTAAQINVIDQMMDDILAYPSNPFYDRATVISSGGSYGFSLSKYLERYRTMDDSGVRLYGNQGGQAYYDEALTNVAVGYTIGTEVNDTSLWDVFQPKFMPLELGENEQYLFTNDSQAAYNNVNAIAEAIHAEFPTIEVAVISTRKVGVWYPERWSDYGYFKELILNNNIKFAVQKLFEDNYGDINMQIANKKYILPCYYVQSPLSSSNVREVQSSIKRGKVLVASAEDVHPGIWALWDYAIQIQGWLLYLL